MRKLKSILMLMLFAIGITYAQAQDLRLGVAIKASTVGIGGDVVFGFHPKMDVRLGFETMSYSRGFSFKESDISYDATADVKLGTASALFDYYLTDFIFVAGGFGYNLFHANFNGNAASDFPYGDISIPKEKVGDFEFSIDPGMKISPYLGIGFGRALSKEKSLAFAFEIGTYFQGSPDLTIVTTGLLSPTMNPELGQEAVLEGQVSQYKMFPVLKLSLSYKILSF